MNNEQADRLINQIAEATYSPKLDTYEIKSGPRDTPLVTVTKNGSPHRDFTSFYAAKCYVEHVQGKSK